MEFKTSVPLRTNISWAMAGNTIYALTQWCVLIILAKLTDTGAVGRYAFAFAICAPIIMCANLRLRLVQTADVASEFSFQDYLYLRVITSTFSLFIIIFIAYVGINRDEVVFLIVVIGMAKVVESISDIIYGLFQKHERLKFVANSLIARGIISVIAVGVVVYINRSVLSAALMLLITWSIILFLYDIPIAKKLLSRHGINSINNGNNQSIIKQFNFCNCSNIIRIKKLLYKAAPLGVVAFLSSLNSNVPRYFIEYSLGESLLGIYAAMAYVSVAGVFIIASIGHPVLPRLSKSFKNKNYTEFYSIYRKMVYLACVMGFVGVVIVYWGGRELLINLYGPGYSTYPNVFLFIMLTATLNFIAIFQWYAMTAIDIFKMQLYLSIFSIILLSSFCYFLIPTYGLKGAALSELTTMIIHVILGSAIINIYVKRNFYNCRIRK